MHKSLINGSGTTKSYKYSAMGLNLKTKADVQKAIDMKLKNIRCKDKITGEIQLFNHKNGEWENE